MTFASRPKLGALVAPKRGLGLATAIALSLSALSGLPRAAWAGPQTSDEPKPAKKPKPEWLKSKKEKAEDAKAKAEAEQKAADEAKAKAEADAKALEEKNKAPSGAKPKAEDKSPEGTPPEGGNKAVPGAKKDDKKESSSPSAIGFKMGFEVALYKDTQATEVISPGVTLGVENDVAGWGIDASFIADVVTAASADIVATASPRWTDHRYAPTLGGHFKVDDTTLSAGGGVSVESDYIAASGSAGVSVAFAQKTITPSLNYSFGYDLAGKQGTPYAVYSKKLQTHGIQSAITFVVNKSTIFVPTATVMLEFGDSAKPYRYLPTFAPGTKITPGPTIAQVNVRRTDVRLEEKVPQSRQRYAASGLIAHRFSSATIRVDERLYIDSWGMMATTTDFMLPYDVSDVFRIWPHVRFHAQKGVDFWNIGYTVKENADGSLTVPGLRAGDRELGPLIGATLGAGVRIGGEGVGFTVKGDAIYTRFLDHLYILQRMAGIVTTQLEMKF